MRDHGFAHALLGWYDSHARDMPWRTGPQARAAGHIPDPYHIWLSEIMLQQTTVATVRDYFIRFLLRWPTVADLAAAQDADVMAQWAGLGYYARARNLLKCARIVTAKHGGQFPETHDALLALPGIGPYTAAAISAIAYDQSETVVDGNVERVMARYFAVRDTLDKAKPKLAAHARRLTPNQRPGDYAQAVMDLGATVCRPRSPDCTGCPVRTDCRALSLGIAAQLPRRAIKPPKPTRYGIVYVARRADGAWLLERRPANGLLGAMLGWPGSDWGDTPIDAAPLSGPWQKHDATIKHTFTHFHLHLSLQTLSAPNGANPAAGSFMPAAQFRPSDLPTVMRKVHDAAARVFQLD